MKLAMVCCNRSQAISVISLLVLALSFLLAISLHAEELVLGDDISISILRNAPAEASLEDVCCGKLQKYFAPLATPGFSTKWGGAPPLWLKIVTGGEIGVLELDASAEEIIFYKRDPVSNATEISRSGKNFPTANREIIAPTLAFSITENDLSKELFLKVDQNSRFSSSIALVEKAEFFRILQKRNLVRAGLYGAILLMIMYNAFLSFVVRDITFFLNAVVISQYLWLDLSVTGVGSAYIWPSLFNISNKFSIYSTTSLVLFGSLFIYTFLKTPGKKTGPERVMLSFVVLAAILAFAQFLLSTAIAQILVLLLSWVAIPTAVFITLYLAFKGQSTARILLVPLGGALVPGMLLVLLETVFGLQIGQFDTHMLEITLVFEALLFSLALAYRIRLAETQREEANLALSEVERQSAQNVFAAVDDERRRIAADLHDTAGQGLLTISSQLARLGERIEIPNNEVTKVADYSREVVNEIRRISHDLHPAVLDHLGLEKAIRQLFARLQESQAIDVDIVFEISESDLNTRQKLHLYRIAQEAIGNIAKHAQATKCNAIFEKRNTGISVEISDNGIGMNSKMTLVGEDRSIGMAIIDQRVRILRGDWNLKSTGKGTIMSINFPQKRNRQSELRD